MKMNDRGKFEYLKAPILVTGGAGYIGGQTVLCLLDMGADVIVIDDLSTGARQPFHDKTHFYEGRLQDQSLVENILRKHGVQSILHFAGSIKVDESVANPLKYYENNTDASRKLIAAAVQCDVSRVVFSSTAAVYGTVESDAPVKEDADTNPLNAYGWSKLFTERLLRDVQAAHGLQYAALRYFNVAGADPDLRHGQYLENPVHLIGRSIDAARGAAGPLQIFGSNLPTADGTGVRDYIHVYDLAMAHLAVLDHLSASEGHAESPKGETFNLGYGRGASVLDVIRCIEKILGQAVPHEFVSARLGEAASVIANVDRVNSMLRWETRYKDLESIIVSAVDWVQYLEPQKGR